MAELRKYGVETTISFPLIKGGATNYLVDPPQFDGADVDISKDGEAFKITVNLPTNIGNGVYKLVLTAEEMQSALINITVIDNTTVQAWEDQCIIIETYGHPNAQHEFDLDQAVQPVDITQIKGNTTPVTNFENDYNSTGYNKKESTIGNIGDKTGFSIAGDKKVLDDLNDISSNTDSDLIIKIDAQTSKMKFNDRDIIATLDGEDVGCPSKKDIAAQVRIELNAELERIDRPISECCDDREVEDTANTKPFDPDITTGVK